MFFFQFYFAILSAFSGQIVFERWCIGLYNVVRTPWYGTVDLLHDGHLLMIHVKCAMCMVFSPKCFQFYLKYLTHVFRI